MFLGARVGSNCFIERTVSGMLRTPPPAAHVERWPSQASCRAAVAGTARSPCGILTPQRTRGASMSTPAHDLEAEVLSLPLEDRARLLERLIASFEPQSRAQRAWLELAQRRQAEVRSGKVAIVPGDDALARVRSRLA